MRLVCPLSIPKTQEIFYIRFLSFGSFFCIPSFTSTFPPLLFFTFLHAVLCFSSLFTSEDDANFSAFWLVILQFPLHLVPSWSWSPSYLKLKRHPDVHTYTQVCPFCVQVYTFWGGEQTTVSNRNKIQNKQYKIKFKTLERTPAREGPWSFISFAASPPLHPYIKSLEKSFALSFCLSKTVIIS